MRITKNSLAARSGNLALQHHIHPNIVYKYYFFDCFLKRLEKSQYRDYLVFKGGFLLSHIFGIRSRTTEDIDISLQKHKLTYDFITEMITEIINISIDDLVSFNITSITPIRKDDEYGGYRVKLVGHLENIKQPFYIDIATGDKITPQAIEFTYTCLLTNEEITLKAYTNETIISEKLQAILTRGSNNGRAKDFYDLYVFMKLRNDSINFKILKIAFLNTCKHRNTYFKKEEALQIISQIQESEEMNNSWVNYYKKKKYEQVIVFQDTLEQIKNLIDVIYS